MSADLFDAAAERLALASDLPKSQASLRARGIDAPAAGPLLASAPGAPCHVQGIRQYPPRECDCTEAEKALWPAHLRDKNADRRECEECGADVLGNDPHGFGCPSADPEDFR